MQEMRDFKQILDRTNIQEICSFLLDGVDLASWREKPAEENYEERLRKAEAPLWEFIGGNYPDGKKKG